MRGSWIGPLSIANQFLSVAGADEKDGSFVIDGPPVEYLFRGDPDPEWEIVEIKPETRYFVQGRPRLIVDLLREVFHVTWTTAGLPVQK